MVFSRKDSASSADPAPAIFFSSLLLLGCSLALALLSARFVYGVGHAERPLLEVACVLGLAGLAWMLACRSLARSRWSAPLGLLLVSMSAFFGAVQLWSEPIQEVEFYRYLLDGGISACGESPYALTPAEQKNALETVLDLREALALQGGVDSAAGPCLSDDPRWLEVVSRAPFPGRRSLAPPLAQSFFAAVVTLGGPRREALQAALLAVHIAGVVILALLLSRLGFHPALAAVYGWSPLAVKEFINSAHYEGVAVLFVLCAALALASRRSPLSLALLALAAGCDYLVLLLLPLWLRAASPDKRLAAFTSFCLVFLLPHLYFAYVAGAGPAWSALTQAAPGALAGPGFSLLRGFFDLMLADPLNGYRFALALLAAVCLALAALFPLRPQAKQSAVDVLGGSLSVLALWLLLGPAAEPWRFCWLLPLIALRPRAHWMVLLLMTPAYYLSFFFSYQGMEGMAYLAPVLQFGPFSILLLANTLTKD